ncbi:MAG TPA: membrane protein insertion efficiency factor YidD [Galbitalea sp.]|nr:membrane protein insertion efficiency factor YidD [Galbitalea sp.]
MNNGSAIKNAATFVLLLPRNGAVLILRGYRAVISPLYGDVCRYYPSCSRYTLEAIQEYGLIRGTGLGAWRILRCHPWAAGGVEDIPHHHEHLASITPFGFVVSPGHGKVS